MRMGQYLWKETKGGLKPVFITSKTEFAVAQDDSPKNDVKRNVWGDLVEMIQIYYWRLT